MTIPALAAGAALSLAIACLCYWLTARWIEADNRERFNHLARNAQYIIESRLKGYVDLLRSGASMMRTSGNVSREQFHQYTENLELPQHFPGVINLNFARHVDAQDIPAFLADMARQPANGPDGYPAFTLKPGVTGRAQEVIVYLEPVKPWSNRFGYDIRSRDDVRSRDVRGWLDQSRDTGALISGGLPQPILRNPRNMGMAMRLPVYRHDMPTTTVAQRRAAYIGSIGVGFSMPKLVQGVLHEMGTPDMRLTLVDADTGTVLFDSESTDAQPAPPRAVMDEHTFATRVDIPFSGRVWYGFFSTRKSDAYSGFDRMVPWLASGAAFMVTMLLWALFQTLASSRRRALWLATSMTRELRESQDKLEVSHQNLRRLAAHADQIKEDERKRIAREIHDDLGQNLLALRIEADLLSSRTSDRHPRLHARARATVEQIDATIKSVRQIINDLRPNVLDLGLTAAVEWQIADFRRRTGIACELHEGTHEIEVDDNCATAFFRILQESLNNVSRHARATRVQVALRLDGRLLSMTVADNGQGMPPGGRDKAHSFGLVGIEERVKILGGTFNVRSQPGKGTLIEVTVAVNPPSSDEVDNPHKVELEM